MTAMEECSLKVNGRVNQGMIKHKNGSITFKNKHELKIEINKHLKPILAKAKEEITENIEAMLIPIISTCLNEAFGMGEVRQDKFMKLFDTHMECLNDGVTSLDQYEEWCIDKGYKFYKKGNCNAEYTEIKDKT